MNEEKQMRNREDLTGEQSVELKVTDLERVVGGITMKTKPVTPHGGGGNTGGAGIDSGTGQLVVLPDTDINP